MFLGGFLSATWPKLPFLKLTEWELWQKKKTLDRSATKIKKREKGKEEEKKTTILDSRVGKKPPHVFGGFFFRHLAKVVVSEIDRVRILAEKKPPKALGGIFSATTLPGGFFSRPPVIRPRKAGRSKVYLQT